MPGLWSRVKNWIAGETLTHTDLNAEFDNVISNSTPQMIDDYSTDLAQYQESTAPSAGSLPTSLANEIKHLRGEYKRDKGTQYWYDTQFVSVGAYGTYATIALAVAASKSRIKLCSNITITAEQDFTLSNGVIDGQGYIISASSAIAGAILKISGSENVVKDLTIQGTHTSGTTTDGLLLSGNKNKVMNTNVFQNGAGGTVTNGLHVTGTNNNYNITVEDKAGTITNFYA